MTNIDFTAIRPVLEQARAFGFLGPGPSEFHLDHALAFARLIDSESFSAVDLGSGGGVPGLVLATVFPNSRWILVDSMEKRTSFLQESVSNAGLDGRIDVWRGRAEDFGQAHRGQFDLVTARGFGPPAVTAECAAPLLKVGGRLLVSEPPGASRVWPVDGLAVLGLSLGPSITEPFAVQSMIQSALCPSAYPRRSGIPAKKPLFETS